MRATFLCLPMIFMSLGIGCADAKPNPSAKKILVVYFSHSGNTRAVANVIHELAGGDVFEIVSVDPYPTDYDAVVAQAKREKESGYKPALKTKVENIGSYDVIFIGYPNWWGTLPRPVVTFLSELDLAGKAVIPFCTHEGSGLGRSVEDLEKLCPRSTILEGLAVKGRNAKNAQSTVSAWLRGLKLLKQEGAR
jgi:flavodoxin